MKNTDRPTKGINLAYASYVFKIAIKLIMAYILSEIIGSETLSSLSTAINRILNKETNTYNSFEKLIQVLSSSNQLSTYHFALQECHATLWSERRDVPWVVEIVEKICWMDIHLLEKEPDFLLLNPKDKSSYPKITSFNRLIFLYEREGYLHKALDVAKIGIKFNQVKDLYEALREKVDALESEDEG